VSLRTKVKNALDEARILVLGVQVLLGFHYRAFFEPAFERLPRFDQDLKLAGLALLLAVMGLVLLPAARHRLVERGEDTPALHRFTLDVVGLAVLPFAAVLALDMFNAGWTRSPGMAVALGVATFVVALGFWYGTALVFGHRPPREEKGGEMKLEDKITQVLTEGRVVLPGAQALFGFQLAMTLMQGYERIPESSKDVHLAATCAIALTVIFLMSPPAFHRIVEGGEDTERFHRFASWMVLAAMVTLPLGFAGDLWIVVRKQLGSASAAHAAAALALLFFYGLWFFAMLALRARLRARQRAPT
jgi:Family of unknown function (DUF6328)